MKIVKNLTAKNIIGTLITRREDLDFEDDGSNFRGFEYKGLPLTVSKWNRQIFLSIRVDYLELGSKRGLLEIKFPYSDWMKVEEYGLCDKYNGDIEEFDLDELIADCDTIIAKISQMNRDFEEEVLDLSFLFNTMDKEISEAEENIKRFKTFEWWNVSESDMKDFTRAFRIYNEYIKGAKRFRSDAIFNEIDKRVLKEKLNSINRYGYAVVPKESWALSDLNDFLNKYN